MAYTPDNRVLQSMPSARAGRTDAENRLPRRLFIAITVLGLATYGLSFGPVLDGGDGAGWSIRFAALAALCAAFSLLPSQSPQTLATAVLAAMGFLDALSSVLTADAGWPLTAIVVLNAVQTAAAIAALVSSPRTRADNSAIAGYDAYVDYYNQAVRQYYGQQAAAPQEAEERSGYGQASNAAQAAAHRAPRTSQSGAYSDLVAPQGDYGSFAEGPPTGPIRSVPPAGLPSFRPGPPRADQPEERTEQAERPSSSP